MKFTGGRCECGNEIIMPTDLARSFKIGEVMGYCNRCKAPLIKENEPRERL